MDWKSCLFQTGVRGVADVATLNCIPVVLERIIFWALVFGGILAILFVVVSGFRFMFSGGDPKQVQGARQTLTYAIIGLLIIIFSFVILKLISILTGVPCILEFSLSGSC